jgi:hypothetical protein
MRMAGQTAANSLQTDFPLNKTRVLEAAYWLTPSLFCLVLYWNGLLSWFQQDDFVWVGLHAQVHKPADLWHVIFGPTAHGTFRPLSERVFFLVFYRLFDLDALPYRIWVFITQCANLVLISMVTRRVTGSRMAGFWAPIFWIANTAMYIVMTWSCEYILVACAFSILLAFYLLLRYIETGQLRFYAWQWVVFILGFGAMETNVVYPAIAATYTYLFARRYFRKTLPLFGASAGYAMFHLLWAPRTTTGPYAPHIDGAIPHTFYSYWWMALEPSNLHSLTGIPDKAGSVLVVLFTLVLAGFAVWMARRRNWLPLFFLAWFAIVLAPVLPLREHVTKYYLTLPTIGLAMLAAYGIAYAWQSRGVWRTIAAIFATAFFATAIPVDWNATRWWYERSVAVRNMVMGVIHARALHPGKTILLDAVDDYLFWGAINDAAFRSVGVGDVFLVPGSEARIHDLPTSRVGEFVMAPALTLHGVENNEVVIYRVDSEHPTNITTAYSIAAKLRFHPETPRRIDVANPLAGYLLGPSWYPRAERFRWMPRQATVQLGGPRAPLERLYVSGICPIQQLGPGPLTMTVSLDGQTLRAVQISKGNSFFTFDFPLRPELVGNESVEVSVTVDRTIRLPTEEKDFGLAFGVFDIRSPE